MTKKLIDCLTSDIVECSPLGWKASTCHEDLYSLWLPKDLIDESDILQLEEWAKKANNHLWLGLNKNIDSYFWGDEIDFCIVCDWNFDFSSKERTELGLAEWLLKYHINDLSDDEINFYEKIVYDALIAFNAYRLT